MTSDKSKAFWLGLFVILAICTVAWLFLFLKPSVGDGKQILKIRFTNIEGVTIGTRVNFGGKPVGTVVAIKELYDARSSKPNAAGTFYFYEVVAKVDSRVKVFNYDEVALTTQGLLGEKSIEITPRAAPPGSPPPHDVTDTVLYAKSGDQITEAVQQLTQVATTVEKTLNKVSDFIDNNLTVTLDSLTAASDSIQAVAANVLEEQLPCKMVAAANAIACAMNKASVVMDEIVDNQLVARISGTATSIEDLTYELTHGCGTLARLINSDGFYLQMTSTLCKLETVLSDINHYGLLFQFDRKWQRQRARKMRKMQELCCPEDFTDYMNCEMQTICISLDRITKALCEMNSCDTTDEFRELIGRVEHLLDNLRKMENCHE